MSVRILASSLAKRFCNRKFIGAFAPFLVAWSLSAMRQIMQSSFCSKTAVDSGYNFFISAFHFCLPLSTEQSEKVFVLAHSDEC